MGVALGILAKIWDDAGSVPARDNSPSKWCKKLLYKQQIVHTKR